MNKLMLKLREEHFFKLILGLGNTDLDSIKKIAAIYSLAGVDMFDLTPDESVFESVLQGIKSQNLCSEDFYYCVSFSLGKDKHGRKAHISEHKCIRCMKCIKRCPQEAIKYDSSTKIVSVIQEKCIGCGKCDFCEAISFTKKETDVISSVNQLKLKYQIDCIELHISNYDSDKIKKILKEIKQELPQIVVSICASRENLSDNKLRKLIKKANDILGKDNFVFQADGIAMSGAKDDYSSTLQSVATAQVVQDLEVNVILSGGTNSKTYELAKKTNVKIHGVSIGSYGRNLVKEEIQNPEFWYNIDVFNSALNKARLLVDSVKK